MVSDESSRPAERTAVLAGALTAVFMIAQQVAGKAVRDAFFLSNFAVEDLPKVMIASAALSVIAVLGMSRAMTALSPARVVPVAFVISAGLFTTEWVLSDSHPQIAAVTVYLHMALLGATVISGFWSVINERFDPHTAKRVIAQIAGGATLGGVIGGVVAWQVAAHVTVGAMLIGLGIANVVCAIGSLFIGAPMRRTDPIVTPQRTPSGVRVLRDVPYLRMLGLIVCLGAITEALVDYVLKAEAQSSLGTSEDLVEFFALFYTATGVLSFLIQTTLSRGALKRLGLAGTIAALPGVLMVTGIIGLMARQLWSAVLLRGSETTFSNSLFRSGYELLYTPLAKDKKRPTKMIIDVGFVRLGEAIGSGLTMLIVMIAVDTVNPLLMAFAVVFAGASLATTTRLHRGYVAALADSLRSGAVQLDDDTVVDATTRRTIADTTMALDREKLLAEIQRLRESKRVDAGLPAVAIDPSGDPDVASAGAAVPDAISADPVVHAIVDLRSGDPDRIHAALRRMRPLDPAVIPHVITLLARDDLVPVVLRALRKVVHRCTGQIVDALLDPEEEFVIRRRIPRALVACATQRSADGLLQALADPRFEVRYQSALALLRITDRNREIHVPRREVFAAAIREVEVGRRVWDTQRVLDAADVDDAPRAGVGDLTAQTSRSFEHVFTILALALEREPLQLAYRALSTDDPKLRGTALEYLENVLPNDVRKALWPYVGGRKQTATRPPRPLPNARDDLLKSAEAITMSIEHLKQKIDSSRGGPR